MSLKEYVRKRNFRKTPEPGGDSDAFAKNQRRFVIQKHAASHLHYDFRLELGGTLKSWAVPKGVPYTRGEKRLAMHVEDHPVSYIDFEGTIPKGQYGGGTVMVWDRGTYEPLSKTPGKDLASGKLHFILHGKKLKGEWYLVRLRDDKSWLLIKGGKDMKPVSKKQEDASAISGKTMALLAKGDRVWQSNRNGDAEEHKQPRKKNERQRGSTPLPDFIEPMKARLVQAPPKGNWFYEIKFDGFRAIALRGSGETRLLSRNNKDLGAKFPEVMKSVAALKVRDAILDGEIVALDDKGRSSFQLLQAFEMGRERPPIFYYVFDLPRLDGEDLQKLPITGRKARLEKLVKGGAGVIRYSGSLGTDGKALLKQAAKLGLEGLIGKEENSPYQPAQRSGAWVKIKLLAEQEFVIGGYTNPGGTRRYFGALLVGIFEKGKLKFAGKVGTGYDEPMLKSLHKKFSAISQKDCPFADLPEKRRGRYGEGVTPAEMKRCHWVQPVMVCQVKFSEWTRDDRLRQPVFLGLREDKDAPEVVREKAARQ